MFDFFALLLVSAEFNFEAALAFRHIVRTIAGVFAQRSTRDFDSQRNHALVFFFGHRCAFTRRAAGNQQPHAAVDLPIDERAHTSFIDRAIGFERRNQRGRATSHPVNFHCH